jgi:hypothetical protein
MMLPASHCTHNLLKPPPVVDQGGCELGDQHPNGVHVPIACHKGSGDCKEGPHVMEDHLHPTHL